MEKIENIRLNENGDALILLDQTRLPGEIRYLVIE